MSKNELTTYTFAETNTTLRTVLLNGEPWFVAADACRCLGIDSPWNAYARLGADEKTNLRRAEVGMGNGRDVVAVSESGLYKLIMRSDKPEARKFQDWVTREVLPSIRKDGTYAKGLRHCLPHCQQVRARAKSKRVDSIRDKVNEPLMVRFRSLRHDCPRWLRVS